MGSDASYLCKLTGMNPLIDQHCNPGQILSHIYVKNIFLALKLTKFQGLHSWGPVASLDTQINDLISYRADSLHGSPS